METNQEYSEQELAVLAQENQMAEDQQELAENARNATFCFRLIGGLFLAAVALAAILKAFPAH